MNVERIYFAAHDGDPQIEARSVRVGAGLGIEGDRYYGRTKKPGQNITLVEAEEIESMNTALGLSRDLSCTRRNLVTRGVRLNELVGRKFRVGEVLMQGVELCEPCNGLASQIQTAEQPAPAILKQLSHRAGIRADVLSDGVIEIGSRVTLL